MSYFDDASLVMIPSGYKTSKVYSVKPTDGSGDLAFTRSNDTATRVGPDGLIEKVRTNTLAQSGDFSSVAWTKGNLTLTAGQTDPNGGTNAFLATSTGTSGVWLYQANTGAKTFSIYAKAGTKNFFSIINGTYNNGAGFNLSDQTVTNVGAGSLAKIESVGSGWYRCSVYMSSSAEMLVMLADTSGGSMIIGDTMTFAFAQAETGDIATDYIATTTAAVSVGPVANVPRLDYLNSSCPRLLLEPQRTNLITFSEQFDNAAWLKEDISSVTANAVVSPDGYTNADLVIPNTTNTDHSIYQNSGTGSAQTFSTFAKAGGYNFIFLGANNGVASDGVFFNLSNGTSSQNTSSFTATITSYGNGWYRCTISIASWPVSYAIICTSATGTSFVHAGNGTSGVYVWGAQLEAGAYATSYIPTLGAAVTRGADDCVKSSATSIIGQTEGVVYFEWEYQNVGSSGGSIPISLDGGSGKELYFWVQTNGVYLAEGFDGSVNQFSFTGAMGSFGTKKIAIAYKNNDFALYINGVLAGTDTSGTVPTLNRLYVGRFYANTSYNIASGIKQVLLFPTRLSNADLAALTA